MSEEHRTEAEAIAATLARGIELARPDWDVSVRARNNQPLGYETVTVELGVPGRRFGPMDYGLATALKICPEELCLQAEAAARSRAGADSSTRTEARLRPPRSSALDEGQLATFRTLLRAARESAGMSYQRLANRARCELRKAHLSVMGSVVERERWVSIAVNKGHVVHMETSMRSPLGAPDSRARYLGIVLALGEHVDRDAINRAAGAA